VRLYYGARSGLEMLYMNEENRDLAMYFDEKTFKAFRAVSPRPHFEAPVDLEQAIAGNAAETWAMLKRADTHVYVAGAQAMLETVERALAAAAGSPQAWRQCREALAAGGRWSEVLY
jgi:ferredoxin--NADP+ reductase